MSADDPVLGAAASPPVRQGEPDEPKGMGQQETFGWLVVRHRQLLEIEEALKDFGIEPGDRDGESWWVGAEPGPIECDTLSEAIREAAALSTREINSLRSRLSEAEEAATEVVEYAEHLTQRIDSTPWDRVSIVTVASDLKRAIRKYAAGSPERTKEDGS